MRPALANVAPATPTPSGTVGQDDGIAGRTLTMRGRRLIMIKTEGMASILHVKGNSRPFFGVKWHGSCENKVKTE
jgi:hypothetical protein